jgi:hypothetical protein
VTISRSGGIVMSSGSPTAPAQRPQGTKSWRCAAQDIHALYDAGLLTIGEDGRVGISADPALDACREFDGRMLQPRSVANSATSLRQRRA